MRKLAFFLLLLLPLAVYGQGRITTVMVNSNGVVVAPPNFQAANGYFQTGAGVVITNTSNDGETLTLDGSGNVFFAQTAGLNIARLNYWGENEIDWGITNTLVGQWTTTTNALQFLFGGQNQGGSFTINVVTNLSANQQVDNTKLQTVLRIARGGSYIQGPLNVFSESTGSNAPAIQTFGSGAVKLLAGKGSTLSPTNGQVEITPATGATVNRILNDKQGEHLSVLDFGAVADGVTDNTVAFNTAYTNAIATGSEIFIPGAALPYVGDWPVVTNSVKIYGVVGSYGTAQNGLSPPRMAYGSVLQPKTVSRTLFQIGADTGFVQGVKLQDLILNSTNGSVGVLLAGGSIRNRIEGVMCTGFTNGIVVQGGTNYPSTLNHIVFCPLFTAWPTASARALLIRCPTNQANVGTITYTTGTVITGCNIEGSTNGYAVEIDGTGANFLGGYTDVSGVADGLTGHGFLFSKSTSTNAITATPTAHFYGYNIDAGSATNIAVTVTGTNSNVLPLNQFMLGDVTVSGSVLTGPGGAQVLIGVPSGNVGLGFNSILNNAGVAGALSFMESSSTAYGFGGTNTVKANAGSFNFSSVAGNDIFSKNLGIGGAPNLYGSLEDFSAVGVASAANKQNLSLVDLTPQASGQGGGINLAGIYTGTSSTVGGVIKSEKVNSVDGDYGFNLAAYIRTNGSAGVTKAWTMALGGLTLNLGIFASANPATLGGLNLSGTGGITNASNVLVGEASSKGFGAEEVAGAITAAAPTLANLAVIDTTSQALDHGGAINFIGAYTGTTVTTSGMIRGSKVNSVDGDYGFNLDLYFRTNNGAGLTKGLTISATGPTVQYGALTGNAPGLTNLVISVAHGSNKRSGTAVLAAGTVVVPNTTVASGDYAILSYVTTGTQIGILSAPLSLMTNGSAFVINSSYTNTLTEAGDTNIVAWLLYNQN